MGYASRILQGLVHPRGGRPLSLYASKKTGIYGQHTNKFDTFVSGTEGTLI